jgi:predicted small lipoprotein YifL
MAIRISGTVLKEGRCGLKTPLSFPTGKLNAAFNSQA